MNWKGCVILYFITHFPLTQSHPATASSHLNFEFGDTAVVDMHFVWIGGQIG